MLLGGLALALPTAGRAAGPRTPPAAQMRAIGPELPPKPDGADGADGADAAGSATTPVVAPARPKIRRFGLVIGSNHTLDPSQSPLRFADDDAARIAELLVESGVDTELVTHLDRDSQALYPELVSRAHRPDSAGLDRAYQILRGRMQAARDDGHAVELLVYYSGHGDVGPDGQGFLTLDGDKITRKRLFDELLRRSPAHHNHVIIDACKSEQFVLSRGKDWKPDRAAVDLGRSVQEYLDRQHLGGFPNTGVVLAHSADQQTHEWDRYRGGIFTHELLSGLRGGADLNGDGAIEYSELGAFVSAANHGVDDPRARLEVVVRPPVDDERRPVLEHRDLEGQRLLLFGPGDQHHYVIEDVRGVRVADLRRSGEQPGYLRLPDGELFIERRISAGDREHAQVAASRRGVLMAYTLEFAPAPSAARGALDQAFRRGLFATPFGPGYYHGYTARRGLLAVAEPRWQGPAPGDEPADEPPSDDADSDDDGDELMIVVENDEDEDDRDFPWRRAADSSPWGGLFVGVSLTPFAPQGSIPLSSKRVNANQFESCLVPGQGENGAGCTRGLRGFDLRWQLFRSRGKSDLPRTIGYFRTGYQAGRASFTPADGSVFESGDATALRYIGVPLYLGGNLYLFDKFPLRPYAGLGFGLDVVRLDYARFNQTGIVDTVVRPGFELHAGLEVRILNYVSLVAEIQQQWGVRKKISGVPDFAHEGATVVTGVAIGFPLRSGS